MTDIGAHPGVKARTGDDAAARNRAAPVTVLVVGQLPPPVNGQSLMISAFVEGSYSRLRLIHVPMRFSRSTAEIGGLSFRKILLLFSTLVHVLFARFRTGATVLYYPPAGANLVPVLRDLVLLIPTRWLFQKTVFHFHAAGLCNIYRRLPRLLQFLFRLAYRSPDIAIFTTAATSADAAKLGAKTTAIVPCGIEDRSFSVPVKVAPALKFPLILFAGILCEEKGVLNLLTACRILQSEGIEFAVVCLGAFLSADFEHSVHQILDETGLRSRVRFPGVVTGDEKDSYFADAAIFCFPTHYPAESFGVVLIEAMSFSLPIVATDWQGIPEVLGRTANGPACKLGGSLLVPPRDSRSLAAALRQLLADPAERNAMGRRNRARYLERFTIDHYRNNLESHLASLGTPFDQDCRQQATLHLRRFDSNQGVETLNSAVPTSND